MGLFSKQKEQQTQQPTRKEIQPIIVRTSNVAQELMKVSSSHKIPVTALDFRVLSIQTFTRLNVDGKEEEFDEISANELRDLHKETLLHNEFFEIKQVYEIEIFSKNDDDDKLANLQMSVGANATLTKVYVTIKAGSFVSYYDTLEQDLIAAISKRKLRANLTINIFDHVMYKELSHFMAKIRVAGEYVFDKKQIFLISEGIEPVPTVNDALILHYEKNREQDHEEDRVDYSKRGYLKSVTEGEMLIEYIKPKLGESGRNCSGVFLKPKEPIVKHEPTFSVTEKINVVVGDDNITYIAKVGGYVTFENNTYDIRQDVEISEISFKTTGSIESALDADVSINVREKDILKDAIGMGMEVEVNEINVEGNVGPNAVVRANKAVIEGQTHKSSKIYASHVQINIHKGFVRGDDVRITRLEHGSVEARKVHVSQMMGGRIIANEVEIELLASHATIEAVHRIEIKNLSGEENKLIIDPVVMKEITELLEGSEEQMEEARGHIAEVEREREEYRRRIHESKHAFNEIKKRLLQYKQKGIKMPSQFVKKYKEFQAMYEHYESLKVELQEKKNRYDMLAQQHKSFQNDIFDARIINRDRWHGHNEITFRLIEPKMEVNFLPPSAAKMEYLALMKDENDEYYIKAVDA